MYRLESSDKLSRTLARYLKIPARPKPPRNHPEKSHVARQQLLILVSIRSRVGVRFRNEAYSYLDAMLPLSSNEATPQD